MARRRVAADLEEALNKKGGLTLSQLANYDDLITDALVDRVYFWSEIRKLKTSYHACRGVQQPDVCNILQKHVIVDKDPAQAHRRLIDLIGIHKFYTALKTEDEKEHFERHLRKYINIYLPDCPFEVGTTNRYTIMTAEASIVARRYIKKGESIKYLTGIQVEMNEQEEKMLSSRTDFSIVLSSRRKRPSLFLGPARFANHDCDSNARLNTNGPHGIHIVACKDILPGHEITVTYGDDYFGEDNCECLCGTCEAGQKNGWDPRGPLLRDDSSDEEDEDEQEEMVRSPRRQVNAGSKRKRAHEGPLEVNEEGEEVPRKRGPGRPRKQQRPGKVEGRAGKDAERGPGNSKQKVGKGRLPRKSTSQPARGQDYGGRGLLGEQEDETGTQRDDLLERVKWMLGVIGDRVIADQNKSRTPSDGREESVGERLDGVTQQQAEGQAAARLEPVPMDDAESPRDRNDKHTGPSALAEEESPATTSAREPSKSLDRTLQPGESPRRDAVSGASVTPPKARLPAIKKERSFSMLRNVTNANETHPDVYSVPDSPAPTPHHPSKRKRFEEVPREDIYDFPADESDPPAPAVQEPPLKRKRGRPRKHPRPEDVAPAVVDSSTNDSTSPSSHTDSASNDSHASSATSVSNFTAGNIAQDICNMLTQDVERDSKPDSEEHEVVKVEESSSGQLTPQRGRPATRKSVRNVPASKAVPPIRSIETTTVKDDDDGEEDDVKRGTPRTPGDYHLCRTLLATAYHRWVQCRNCDEHFVQKEAYQTRIACPRCERHSMLYGYYWPKTDKEGKHDTEERILDHRSIHRFIEPEEERTEKKGRKTLVTLSRELEEEMSISRQDSEESERTDRRLRASPRRYAGGSRNRRSLRQTL
ncbi:hypothetical protein B0A50_06177 [Salinomyces thailandicus]|uniref:Histone-lysine N-methyltransferase SET9 n=1 Tax=Salinomyces thailandicus TaxID=706561 RepID=A0A4U0TT49_9PEZI|nr:hypothetical protein B0A50_06177 [Salinomyces thailandica]